MDLSRRRGCLFLLLLLLCHVTAVLLFCKGFLLRRVVIPEYSTCTLRQRGTQHTTQWPQERELVDTSPSGLLGKDFGSSCNTYPRKFKRVVWLLVDALRYDFVDYNSSLNPVPVYRNKLPYIRDLLEERPQNAKLFRFVADPPTTTMQRLKALTTGSLPTFIDVGSNFNSYEITEDSLPYQARANGRNITFIGDDTWLGLYGKMLNKVFDYPSLNVKDLHTVDNGVIDHMVPELKKSDSDFIIGHFLGVDHVGHTYGPSHWTMGDKLTQMNEVLKSIFAAVDDDTIVFVFGDHGMTASGDHGGESEMETTAALLMFTPRPMFDSQQPSGRSLYQIDIVPTVSVLLGLPIPFSSLGMIIPEVFLPWQPGQWEERQKAGEAGKLEVGTEGALREEGDGYKGRVTYDFISALQINTEQVKKYLKTYVKHSEDFPSDVYISLEKKLTRAQEMHEKLKSQESVSQAELTEVASAYVDYMRDVKAMCRNVWAKFDDLPIALGIVLFALTVLVNLLSLLNVEFSVQRIQKSIPIACGLGTLVSLVCLVLSPLPMEVGVNNILDLFLSLSFCPLLVLLLLHIWCLRHQIHTSLRAVITSLRRLSFIDHLSYAYTLSIVVTVGGSVSLLSNSYILYEGDTTIFFIQGLLICFVIGRLQQLYIIEPLNKRKRRKQQNSIHSLSKLWPIVLAMVLVRLTKLFHDCRDLQVGCEATSFIQPYQPAAEVLGRMVNLRLLSSCLGVMCVPLALALFVKWNTNSKHLSWYLLSCVYFVLPVASVCVCGFWLVQTLSQPTLDSLPQWQHVILPRAVYSLCVSTVLVCFVCPFTKALHGETSKDQYDHCQNGENLHPNTMEGEIRRRRGVAKSGSRDSFPGQPVSSTKGELSLHLRKENLAPLVVLVLLVALWLPIALLLNDGIALSAVVQVFELALIVSSLSGPEESSWPVVVLWGLISSQFFFGFGHHATVVSLRFEAGFVGIHGNIAGLNLLFAGALVGINMLSSQLLMGVSLPLLLTIKRREKSTIPSKGLLVIGLQYIAFHSIKTLVTMVAASLHRRHLMVWGVFSPRFLYEAAFQATTDCCVLLMYAFMYFIMDTDHVHVSGKSSSEK